jgi:DNA-binding NarL/FixJ family response regulator
MERLHDFSYMEPNQNNRDRCSDFASGLSTFDSSILQNAIENLFHGILVLTEQQDIIYANDFARQNLARFVLEESSKSLIPKELWLVCESLIQSRKLFPGQHWLMHFEVAINDLIALDVQVQWLKMKLAASPVLLLIMKDRNQSSRNFAREEAQKYDLTPREQEVWLLHRDNYTYKQIASVLNITPNTVKKHMHSIYTKRKAFAAGVTEPHFYLD